MSVIEEHIFEFMGQRLHFDIHDLGQNYLLKIVHRAADRSASDKTEPYIRKDFSLKRPWPRARCTGEA